MEDKLLYVSTLGAPPIELKEELSTIEYEIKGENNLSFNFTIIKERQYINFIVKENEDIFILYKKILSLQDFYDSNRIFRQYISIDELFDLYLKKLTTSEITIDKSDNIIKIIFLIEFRGEKDEIPFILYQNQFNIEEVIKNICEKVKEYEKNEKENNNKIKELEIKLNEKDIIINNLIKKVDLIEKNLKESHKKETEIKNNQDLEKKLNEKDIIINNLIKKVDKIEQNYKEIFNKKETEIKNNQDLENKLNEKDTIINNLIQKINLIEQNYKELYNKKETEIKNSQDISSTPKNKIDSTIIKDNEFKLIEKGIKKNFNKKVQRYELLIRGTRDGFLSKDFHSKCDGHNYTVAIVETKKGRRFGGFTEETWDQSKSWKKGPKSFIFSLDNKEIYYYKNKDSIFCYDNENPNFLAFGDGHDFKLCEKCNEDAGAYDHSGKTFDTNGKTYALAGEHYFCIKDYEVHKIYFE